MSCSTATTAALFYRSLIADCLAVDTHTIKFQKKDKSLRTMTCTLDPNLIPQEEKDEISFKPQSLTNQPVYDLESSSWKSFNFTTLVEIDETPVTEFLSKYLDNIFIKPEEKE